MRLGFAIRALKVTSVLSLAVLSMGAAHSVDQDDSYTATESTSATTPNLKRITSAALPQGPIDDADQGDWEAGDRASLQTALERQLAQCQTQSQTATWDFAGKRVSRKRWCISTVQWFLNKLETVNTLGELYAAAKDELEWYQSVGKPDSGEVQFTGYYYPVRAARKTPDATFKYPIYQKPAGNAHFTREQILNGALNGQHLEIGYLNNPVDAFMLEIQGSGALIFTDASGTETRQIVNYAGQNGYPYTSLGGVMRRAGIDETYINMQGIRKYFTDVHPDQWVRYSNQNKSYVYFQTATEGPFGASSVVLTPKHSIAVDLAEFPMGAVGMIQTDRPSQIDGDQATSWKNFFQFVVAQDTGGAIKSPGRVDVFWGEGNYAEVTAGRTDRLGKLFFCLVPDTAAARQ